MLAHPLLPKLRRLRLSGMAYTLDTRCSQAISGGLSPLECLSLLLDDEIERRTNNSLKLKLAQSGLDPSKTLGHFDFAAAPQLNRSLVTELATCAFVARAENLLLCGPTGTGKSHLVNAIGFEALKRGYTVVLKPLQRLLADLCAARADGTHARRFARLCSLDLLILDDFGLRPLSSQAADELYELISERYERHAIAVTSNRAFGEWAEVFGDGLLANAALDRLTHHCVTLVMRGSSYRQRGRHKEEPLADTQRG